MKAAKNPHVAGREAEATIRALYIWDYRPSLFQLGEIPDSTLQTQKSTARLYFRVADNPSRPVTDHKGRLSVLIRRTDGPTDNFRLASDPGAIQTSGDESLLCHLWHMKTADFGYFWRVASLGRAARFHSASLHI
jgi:hypothetical protein